MPASQEQKVDFLLKKIGYSASKTGIAEDSSLTGSTKKAPFAEAIPSPLVVPASSLWGDTSYIPTTPPVSDTAFVKVYSTSSAYRMTHDATVGAARRTYIARSTYGNQSSSIDGNWIDTQFGADYIIKVYKGDPNSGGTLLQQAGANAETDGWFFDYSSGVLNFNGTNLPSGITETNIYLVGYRYIGRTGVQPPAGIGTFEHLYVSGISTFVGQVNVNNDIVIGGDLTINGTQNILNSTKLAVADINIGIASATSPLNDLQLDGAGITIHSSNVDKTITWDNTNSWIGINTTFNASRIVGSATTNIIPFLYANYDDLPSASSYHGAFAHAHNTGKAYFAHAANWMELVSRELNGVVGTGTDAYNIGILNATQLTVSGISTFNDDVRFVGAAGTVLFDKSDNALEFGDSVRAKFGASTDMEIYHTTASGGTNFIKGTGNLTLQSNVIVLEDQSGNDYIRIDNGGAVKIHHPGTTEKIRTTSTGVQVTGLTDTDTLLVSGISTFSGNLDINANVDVDGLVDTTTLNTGNATFTGTISAGSTTGTDGYYLKSVGTGVTWAQFPNTRTGLTTTATAGQTSFNFSYNVGFIDVFLNGVKLPASEFTASNGSTIVLDDAAFVNDTLEFVSYNTVPNSNTGAQNLTGLADVTITGTPVIGETLQHNGTTFVNDYTVSTTTTSTSQTAISSLPIATYRSAEYTIQVTEGTKYHVTKVLAIHDGTNVTFNEYGTLTTSTSLSTFTLDISSGNMRLLATPASTNSTAFKVKFTGIKV